MLRLLSSGVGSRAGGATLRLVSSTDKASRPTSHDSGEIKAKLAPPSSRLGSAFGAGAICEVVDVGCGNG